MFHTSNPLLRLHDERMRDLRNRAAIEAIVAALTKEKRLARREATLAATREASEARKRKADNGWHSQRRLIGLRLRGAR